MTSYIKKIYYNRFSLIQELLFIGGSLIGIGVISIEYFVFNLCQFYLFLICLGVFLFNIIMESYEIRKRFLRADHPARK